MRILEMSMEKELAAVIEKYRTLPQFLGIEITDVNQRGDMGDSLLHFAAVSGSIEDIDALVASGAEVNAIGDIGNTPLHDAAMRGRVSAVERLLELGADPAIKNDFGEIAADYAKNLGRNDVTDLLRSSKVRQNG